MVLSPFRRTPNGDPRHVSWSPDGTRLAAVTDHRLWAWDVATGKPLGTPPPGHEAMVTALAFGRQRACWTKIGRSLFAASTSRWFIFLPAPSSRTRS